ncbi:hypothetical protein CK203_022310 [Vitis vinifera]|uniref:Uncharacterized protein n=1 Tax=Vitis vinifera TaxID=29760 RepID=A0A438I990_VITVI|nr:hypothetical protein CK203_022310 [Vitis vinifera]
MVARATWFDGSHCIKFSENGLELTLFLSSETPSKKKRLEFGNQRLNRFQQLDPMAGAVDAAAIGHVDLPRKCCWGCSFSHYRPHIKAPLLYWSKGLQAPIPRSIQAPISSVISGVVQAPMQVLVPSAIQAPLQASFRS